MICNLDCFHCKFDDCINDEILYSDIVRSEKQDKEASVKPASKSKSAKYLANREKILARKKRYYFQNREHCLAVKALWRDKNRDQIKLYNHEYYLKNRERIRLKNREYRIRRKLAQKEKADAIIKEMNTAK